MIFMRAVFAVTLTKLPRPAAHDVCRCVPMRTSDATICMATQAMSKGEVRRADARTRAIPTYATTTSRMVQRAKPDKGQGLCYSARAGLQVARPVCSPLKNTVSPCRRRIPGCEPG
jgi:hypothetical protein